jgi:pimeloyl-ACP methyl ester carboxylesterase
VEVEGWTKVWRRQMPSRDRLYPVQTLRMNRREVLQLAVLASSGLAGMLLFGCGGEGEVQETPTPLPATVAPSGFFDSDGVKIHYQTFGQGKPIVLVHGFASSLEGNWVATKWVETLQPVRQVVALDCRGHGQSDKPHDPEAYGGENMAQDVLRLMDYLNIAKADLFGYSMGAGIAIYLLVHHRERFTSVILGGIGNVFQSTGGERARVIADALLARDASQITDPVGVVFRAFAELDPNNDLEALAACALRVREPIDRADLADVDIPVLIVDGGNDVLARNPDELAAAIPGARLVIIPDRDHLTVVPDPRFKEEVLGFLEQQ